MNKKFINVGELQLIPPLHLVDQCDLIPDRMCYRVLRAGECLQRGDFVIFSSGCIELCTAESGLIQAYLPQGYYFRKVDTPKQTSKRVKTLSVLRNDQLIELVDELFCYERQSVNAFRKRLNSIKKLVEAAEAKL